jgi:hypothetical protein
MSQVTGFLGGGIKLTNATGIFCGVGDPNSSATPDVRTAGNVSLFLRQDVPSLYICTSGPTLGAGGVLLTAATWVAIL